MLEQDEIRLYRFISRSPVGYVFHALRTRRNPRIVLVYHGVAPQHPSCVDPILFREHIAYLREHCRIISLDDVLNAGEHADRPAVAITFDDAFANLLDYALPVLSEYNAAAVIYAATDYLGRSNDWDHGATQQLMPIMTGTDVRYVHSQGFEIGSHSRSHIRLRGLTDFMLHSEIVDSKKILEDLLGEQIGTFAYPHGGRSDFDGRAADAVKEAGYRSAATTLFGRHNDPSHRYEIRRIIIWPGDTTHELQRKIDGHYDWLTFKEIAVHKMRAATGRTRAR
ncbi:MAG: Polysaccharide deacetylase [Syntrophus sp. PtaU1.Bin208]|nr:MAG: Polysaccharide deacetylase [Syntrophus sp. PtaU1.Bin208]